MQKNSLKPNAASYKNASWYTGTDGFLEHSPSGGSLYYKGTMIQKIITDFWGSLLVDRRQVPLTLPKVSLVFGGSTHTLLYREQRLMARHDAYCHLICEFGTSLVSESSIYSIESEDDVNTRLQKWST